MSSNTRKTGSPVDYPKARSAKAARETLTGVAAEYVETAGRTAGITVRIVMATRDALRLGVLIDGRTEDTDRPGTITKGAYVNLFAYTDPSTNEVRKPGASMVSFWITMAQACGLGVVPGDALWKVLAGSAKAAQRSIVREGIEKASSKGDIVAALTAAGLDPVTGRRTTDSPSTPRGVDGTGGDPAGDQGTGGEVVLTPTEVAAKAVDMLRAACKSPTIQAEEWHHIRTTLHQWIAQENRRRGEGATRKASKTSAAPALAPTGTE